uniref:Ig-like domain-containing protein n=1 Tax=Naja naja TaxID=35670 RepID=A0A8C6VNW5_NAJNA
MFPPPLVLVTTILGVGLACSLDAQVIQTPAELEVQDGDSFTVKCNYSTQYQPYYWYHQLPGAPPSLILSISSQEDQNSKGFVAKYLENGKESQLHRPKAQFQDSGSYFCAVDAQ